MSDRRRALRRPHPAAVLFAVAVLLSVLNLFWTSHKAGQLADVIARQNAAAARQHQVVRRLDGLVVKLRREVTANCAADRDLSPLPVTAGPTGKASLLGVEIIADFRGAWYRAGCAGELPPPSPSLEKWAAYYHRKVR